MKQIVTFLFSVCLALTANAQGELPQYPRVNVATNAGNFTMELFTARAPYHVENFVELVNSGFYEGTVFHRVIGGFVVQAGGYTTDYKLKETTKTISNESGNGLSNRRSFIGMARTGEPHSADSQFFINLADNVALDPRPTRWGYTVFGRVTEGMEVVDEIGYRSTGSGPIPELSKDVPQEAIVILSMQMAPSSDAPTAAEQ